jgi:transglutaminase/protease-like cytokinesis protein 3
MKIVNGAKKKKSTRAKVKYVNSQICKTCSYHYAAYRAHKKGNYTKYKYCYDAYGCLVEHKAVCAGYSEAFATIMTELNIPNTYANSPNHRWNKVKIG